MPIQTQRFTPLQHKHYKLAKTQSELDEELRRKRVLQDDKINAQNVQANSKAANTANIANANLAADAKVQGAKQKQNEITNGLATRSADREDAELAANTEQQGYERKQLGLDRERQNKLDNARIGLGERKQANDDARIGREKFENERTDAEYQKKETFKNKTLALGSFGDAFERAIADDKVVDGEIDLSGYVKEFKVLHPDYIQNGPMKGRINETGSAIFFDDKGPIKLNGEFVQPTIESMRTAKVSSDDYRKFMMTGKASSGDKKVIAEANRDFKYSRNRADKLEDEYKKFILENSVPVKPPETASKEEKQAYNEQSAPHRLMIEKIKKMKADAEDYKRIASGGRQVLTNLRPTGLTPETSKQGPADPIKTEGLGKPKIGAKQNDTPPLGSKTKKPRGMRNPPALITASGKGLDPEIMKKLPKEVQDDLKYYLRNR